MSLRLLVTHRRFTPFFWVQFLGALNDNFLKNALVVSLTFQGIVLWGFQGEALVALAGGLFILPFLLFSAHAGQLADRMERSSLIRFIKLFEVFIAGVACVGFYFHAHGLLIGMLFLMGVHSTFFGPIKYSILQDLVEDRELVTGNAWVEAGTFFAILLGTLLGGLAVSFEASDQSFVVIGLLSIALLGLLISHKTVRVPIPDPHLKINWKPLAPTLEITRWIYRQKKIFPVTLAISWFWWMGLGILSLLPPFTKDILGANEKVVTVFLATFTVGIAVGSGICGFFSKGKIKTSFVIWGGVGLSLFLLDLFFITPGQSVSSLMGLKEFFATSLGWRVSLDLFLVSVSGGAFVVPLYTLMQKHSLPQFKSRTIAANNIINSLFMVVGAIVIMGLSMGGFKSPKIFLALSVMNLVFCGFLAKQLERFRG